MPKANLVIRPEKLGDLVVATPVFRAFKETYPDQPLHVMTDELYAEAIRHDPHIDKIIPVRWKARTSAHRDSFRTMYRELRPYSYERAAILYYNSEILNWLVEALRIPHVAQLGGTVAAYLFRHRQIRRQGNVERLHYSKFYLRVAAALGATTTNEIPTVYLAPGEVTAFRARFPFLEERKKRIIVHPFGHGSAPNYSLRAYAELIEILAREPGVEVFVTGTSQEKETWQEFRHVRARTDWIGNLNIREWMVAAREVDLVIAGSTGVTHVAAALGQQTIGIYCPFPGSHPDIWGPLGMHTHLFTVPASQCKAIQPCESGCERGIGCDLSFALKPAMIAEKALEIVNDSAPS